MTEARKVEILYKRAKGELVKQSPEEKQELKKYKISYGEAEVFVTKANIRDYVRAVDNGYRLAFEDWCYNNRRTDRRMASAKEVADADRSISVFSMLVGTLPWGVAFYSIIMETNPTGGGGCLLLGAIVSGMLGKISRNHFIFILVVLPMIIASIFFA